MATTLTTHNQMALSDILKERKSFNYHPDDREPILCRCRNENFYYAYRKVNSKQRQEYLGKADDICFEKLDIISELMNLPDTQYWQIKEDKKNKPKKLSEKEKDKIIREIIEKIEDNTSGYRNNSATQLRKDILFFKNHLND